MKEIYEPTEEEVYWLEHIKEWYSEPTSTTIPIEMLENHEFMKIALQGNECEHVIDTLQDNDWDNDTNIIDQYLTKEVILEVMNKSNANTWFKILKRYKREELIQDKDIIVKGICLNSFEWEAEFIKRRLYFDKKLMERLKCSLDEFDYKLLLEDIEFEKQEDRKSARKRMEKSRRFVETELEIENVELYEENLRKIQSRMITGITLSKEGNMEIDGEMFATTDIGKKRKNQEDAVLLLKDEDIGLKLMVVADGMGGADKGEVASHRLVDKIKRWFEGLSKEEKEHYYSNINAIQQKLNSIIMETSLEINNELFRRGGATFVCSIIGKDKTIITNVGDSRAYIVKDGRLEQISVDDAVVQERYENGEIPSRDAMRFHRKSNVITSVVGGGRLKNIHSSILKNEDYDMILLFSDGVTDCLSEEEIAVITRTTDKSKLSQELVKKALENLSIAPKEVGDRWEYVPEIQGGKDNTTAAIYVKDEYDEDKSER